MSKMDKISVIIPVYNAEKCIVRSLCSVCNSTYQELEIIVVNDGSSDGTEEIVLNFQAGDKRIRYYSKANGGVSSARNLGIKVATGKIIMFLDADDTYEPKYCEMVAKEFDEKQVEIVMAGYKEFFDEKLRIQNCPVQGNLDSQEQIYSELIQKVYLSGINGYLGSVCLAGWLTEKIRKLNLSFHEEIHHGEDKLFLMEYLLHCERLSVIPFPMYNYYLGDASVTKRYCSSLGVNNHLYSKEFERILIDSGHSITSEMRACSAVTEVISGLVNEARAGNPKPFLLQVREAGRMNKDKKKLIHGFKTESRVMRIKRIITGNSLLCICFFLIRRVQRSMGVYF